MRALDFRLRKKIFATLTPENIAGFKLTPEVQAILLEKSPRFFKANGAWGDKGWTKASLAELMLEDAEIALHEAWRGGASKRQLLLLAKQN